VVVRPVTGAVAEALAAEVTPGHVGRGEIQWAHEVDFVHAEEETQSVTLHFRHAHVAVAFQLVFQGAELSPGAPALEVELVTSWGVDDKAKPRAPLPTGPPPPPPLELWTDDEKPKPGSPTTPSKEGLELVSPGSTRASTTYGGTPSWSLPSSGSSAAPKGFKADEVAFDITMQPSFDIAALLRPLPEPAPLPL